MKDIIGTALLDYFHGKYTEDIITETNISDEDELPLPYFFRSFNEMPSLEQKALTLVKGKILDVGCGAGSHALYLQEKGFDVTAIDVSPGAIEVCKLRGVNNAKQIDLLKLNTEKFDTILMLMNGTGIFQKLENISQYLLYLKSLLTHNGFILIDSSDLKYMYDEGEGGGIWIPGDHYYGELEFTMKYKKMESEPFDWLYLDEAIFENAALSSGFNFEVLDRGENFDYLAKLSV
jgi:SAM-dependent methyltransferase